jgi:hypothetical protein
MPEPEHIDPRGAALIAYDVCRRVLTPSEPVRRAAMLPVLNARVQIIAVARAAGVPVIYTTPVSRPTAPTSSCCRLRAMASSAERSPRFFSILIL